MAELSKKCGGYERTFLHAEVLAIIRALKNGKPHKIKIERYFKNGEPAMAAPCQICLQAIKEAGITVVEHTVG
jgi:cytidine deaminase